MLFTTGFLEETLRPAAGTCSGTLASGGWSEAAPRGLVRREEGCSLGMKRSSESRRELQSTRSKAALYIYLQCLVGWLSGVKQEPWRRKSEPDLTRWQGRRGCYLMATAAAVTAVSAPASCPLQRALGGSRRCLWRLTFQRAKGVHRASRQGGDGRYGGGGGRLWRKDTG